MDLEELKFVGKDCKASTALVRWSGTKAFDSIGYSTRGKRRMEVY